MNGVGGWGRRREMAWVSRSHVRNGLWEDCFSGVHVRSVVSGPQSITGYFLVSEMDCFYKCVCS